MRKRQYSILDELIVDNFAGGGGASTGIELALGRPVDIAINHDISAIAMHEANHPLTRHFCESVWDIDPVKVTQGRPVALCWFSPDCKHFSKAKGGKPVEKNIRGLAWVAVRWAATVKPRVIILENVEEFQTWGPLRPMRDPKTGRVVVLDFGDRKNKQEQKRKPRHRIAEKGEIVPFPLQAMEANPKKKGQTFRQLVKALEGLGYKIEWKELVAADYGAPTIRKRFFLIARCDGRPIVWPEPTHTKGGAGGLKPWRSAAEIIDWNLPCPSIFSSKEEIKKQYALTAVRPLADNTMRRVARGVDKFVIKAAEPFIVDSNHTSSKKAYDFFRGQDIEEPLLTITGKHGRGLCMPTISPFTMTNTSNAVGTDARDPVNTARTGGGCGQMLVTPVMTAIGQTGAGDRARSVGQPVITVVSKQEACLIAPSLIQYHQEQPDEYVRGQRIDKPAMTLDAANRYGLSAASLIKYYGQGIGQDLHKPAHTVTARDREALTVAFMSKYFSGGHDGKGNCPEEPLNTITTAGHSALAAAHVVKFKGDNLGQFPQEPIQTATAGGGQFAVAQTFLAKASGINLHRWPQVRALLNQHCGYSIANNEVLLLEIGGELYFIADIGLRMLTPRELYNANGFPADYIIEVDAFGREYKKSDQVARCGNAVPPPFAEALARANLPELAAHRRLETMEALKDYMVV